MGFDGHAFVFADVTGTYQPNQWASPAISLAIRGVAGRSADAVTAETNQGGEMVKAVLEANGSRFRYIGTHVKDGKRARAEPVANFYDLGMVHHVGVLAKLEDEMISWNAQTKKNEAGNIIAGNDASPIRIAAMTRCFHKFLQISEPDVM